MREHSLRLFDAAATFALNSESLTPKSSRVMPCKIHIFEYGEAFLELVEPGPAPLFS